MTVSRPDDPPHPTAHKERWTAWLLVFGQFALLAPIVLLPGRANWTLPTGLAVTGGVVEVVGLVVLVVAAAALGRGLTPAPLPNEHAQLRTRGLYAYVRHPIYSGLLLFAVARTLTHGGLLVATACVLLIVLINMKARWEEAHLLQRFPDYFSYARRTPRFHPRAHQALTLQTEAPLHPAI
jgi:protein-S-isoprenylcysteine O-methyltransferase Ste14